MSEDLIRRSDAIKVAKEFWYKPDIAGALAELPTIKPKTKVIAQVTFDEEKLREIVKEAVERIKEEYEIADRPQGEWIDDDFVGQYRCSECDYYAIDEYDYCPNCGSKMRGEHDD